METIGTLRQGARDLADAAGDLALLGGLGAGIFQI